MFSRVLKNPFIIGVSFLIPFVIEAFVKLYLQAPSLYDTEGNYPYGSMFFPSGILAWLVCGLIIGHLQRGNKELLRTTQIAICFLSILAVSLTYMTLIAPEIGYVFVRYELPLATIILGSLLSTLMLYLIVIGVTRPFKTRVVFRCKENYALLA